MILKNNLYIINSVAKTPASWCYNLSPVAESEIYAAHFPGKPITPGVCLIQIAKELLEESLSMALDIKAVKNVKFLSVLSPATTKGFDVLIEKTMVADKQVSAVVTIFDATVKYAKISFTCSIL